MGSVSVRKIGKAYQYSFDVAKVNGKRKRITKSGFKTKSEAINSGIKALNEYRTMGHYFKEEDISFSDYLDYWMEKYCKVNLKYNTYSKYNTIIEKYLKPSLGYFKLTSLTSVKLNSFIVELCEKNKYSRAYFSNILKVLKGAFREATDVFGFIKYNPTLTLRLPRIDEEYKEVKHVYSQEEIDKILNRFKDNPTFTLAFLTSCFTGLRTGEVFALSWNDIDFENRIIHVNNNIYDKPKDNKGRWYIGSTKTKNGKRDVYISDTLYKAFRNFRVRQHQLKLLYGKKYKKYHVEECANEYGKTTEKRIVQNTENDTSVVSYDFIFTRNDGTFVGTDILRHPFKIIRNELGLKYRFYDLRGSYATKILNSGIEIRSVADNLGHKNIETTENYYISSSDNSRREANKVLEKIIASEIIDSICSYKIN